MAEKDTNQCTTTTRKEGKEETTAAAAPSSQSEEDKRREAVARKVAELRLNGTIKNISEAKPAPTTAVVAAAAGGGSGRASQNGAAQLTPAQVRVCVCALKR